MIDYLFVCSVNMLRSPTAEHVARMMGYTADSAGSHYSYRPVRPLTLDAIERAATIVCMEKQHRSAVLKLAPHREPSVQVWDIADSYAYCDPELMEMIRARLPRSRSGS